MVLRCCCLTQVSELRQSSQMWRQARAPKFCEWLQLFTGVALVWRLGRRPPDQKQTTKDNCTSQCHGQLLFDASVLTTAVELPNNSYQSNGGETCTHTHTHASTWACRPRPHQLTLCRTRALPRLRTLLAHVCVCIARASAPTDGVTAAAASKFTK